MRTTLTLDDDVAAKLKTASRRTGRSFRDMVNEALRRGLAEPATSSASPFSVQGRDLGALRSGLNLDKIAELLKHIEEQSHL